MKRILIISIIMVTLISFCIPSFAFEFNQVNLYKKGDCGSLLKYFGNTLTISYVVYKYNGKEYPAYCLNSNLSGAENGSYSVETLSKLNDNLTWKVIINGFPYKTPGQLGVANEYEAFAATKQAVYWAWEERPESQYSAVDSDAGRRTYNAFKKIIAAAKADNRQEPVNTVLNILPVTNNWSADNKESDRISKTYKVTSSVNQGTFTINLNGEVPSGIEVTDLNNNLKDTFAIGDQFKITIPIKNLNKNGNFVISASANLQTYPVLYGKTYSADKQDYAITGLVHEFQNAVYSDSYQTNNTKIIVNKKEYGSSVPMQNVVFQLQDADHNILKNNVKTDGNGQIKFNNLLPGKYYLKEISTLEGYTPYTELIEIDVRLFEETEVTVYNNKSKDSKLVINNQTIEVTSNENSKSIVTNTDKTNLVENTYKEAFENNYNTALVNSLKSELSNENNLDNEVINNIDESISNKNNLDNLISNDIDNSESNINDLQNMISNSIKNGMINVNKLTDILTNALNNHVINENDLINIIKNLLSNQAINKNDLANIMKNLIENEVVDKSKILDIAKSILDLDIKDEFIDIIMDGIISGNYTISDMLNLLDNNVVTNQQIDTNVETNINAGSNSEVTNSNSINNNINNSIKNQAQNTNKLSNNIENEIDSEIQSLKVLTNYKNSAIRTLPRTGC